MDTTNILFVCGGAFVGLENIIERRIGKRALGFGAAVPETARERRGAILNEQQPADLIRYGLIPEFVGRLPVVATLHHLGEAELIRIMTEPKNAIVRAVPGAAARRGGRVHLHRGGAPRDRPGSPSNGSSGPAVSA